MTATFTQEEAEQIQRIALRTMCERDHLVFTRYFFKLRESIKFQVNWHHAYIGDHLQKVIDGEIVNLLINVAPGSSKTQLAVVNFIARGLALNPRARFLHLSYSDDLTSLNSAQVREIVSSEEYQELWPIAVHMDSRAKKRWNVTVDGRQAGGVYAAAIGGQVTGFRGGHMADGFQGAILVDDPLKPEDAFSPAKRNTANRKLLSTVKSRKAWKKTPTVVIMQRLAEEDCSGFIMGGNVPGEWVQITIPALIDDEFVKRLPAKYRLMVDSSVRDKDGRFSYWQAKEPLDELLELEAGGKKDKAGNPVSKFVFHSQYQQQPTPMGGALIKGAWFRRYSVVPHLVYRIITADTAQKTAERNDFSVFQHWGLTVDGYAILLDQIRGKWEASDLKRQARDFWVKCVAQNSIHGRGKLRGMKVEDKSSGTGLIQDLANPTAEEARAGIPRIPVEPVERVKDKLTEWMDAIPYLEARFVMIPEVADWLSDFITECESLTAQMTHSHDDQVDPMCDAVDELLGQKNELGVWAQLAGTGAGKKR